MRVSPLSFVTLSLIATESFISFPLTLVVRCSTLKAFRLPGISYKPETCSTGNSGNLFFRVIPESALRIFSRSCVCRRRVVGYNRGRLCSGIPDMLFSVMPGRIACVCPAGLLCEVKREKGNNHFFRRAAFLLRGLFPCPVSISICPIPAGFLRLWPCPIARPSWPVQFLRFSACLSDFRRDQITTEFSSSRQSGVPPSCVRLWFPSFHPLPCLSAGPCRCVAFLTV